MILEPFSLLWFLYGFPSALSQGNQYDRQNIKLSELGPGVVISDKLACHAGVCTFNRYNGGLVSVLPEGIDPTENIELLRCRIDTFVSRIRELDEFGEVIRSHDVNLEQLPLWFAVSDAMSKYPLSKNVYTVKTSLNGLLTKDRTLTQVEFGRLSVDSYIFREKKWYTQGEGREAFDILPGDVKVNFTISDWNWCNRCGPRNQTGTSLEVVFAVTGNRRGWEFMHAKDGYGPRRKGYDVGSGQIIVSGTFMRDWVYNELPPGYPIMDHFYGRNMFVIRMPRFVKDTMYEGVRIRLKKGVDCNVASSLTVSASLLSVMAATLVAFMHRF